MMNHPEAQPALHTEVEIVDSFYDSPGHEHFMRISDTKMRALFGVSDEYWAQLAHSSDATAFETA